MRNYSYYPSTPGFGTGNMSMIQGKFMPSNPNFVGAGANKNFNPYIQGKFMPSNPDFVGVGAPVAGPESNLFGGGLKKNYKKDINFVNDEQNPYGKIDERTGLPTSGTGLPTSINKERDIFKKREKKVENKKPKTPEEEKKKPFDFEEFMKNREAFSQKILNQAYIAGGADAAGRSILEGSKVAAESVVPNMIAGTTGLLASMAQGNKSIAAAFGVPISVPQRMGYYS